MRLPSIKETSRLVGDARWRSVGIAASLAVGPVRLYFLRRKGFSCASGFLKTESPASSLESPLLVDGATSKSEH
jgi:hypothetical protein